MNNKEKIQYGRQIHLPQIAESGQQRLLDARVFIVGMGGLGSPVALYLAAAGVGHLVICDYDHVELSNLQRQIIHRRDSIGELKVVSAARTIHALNPDITVNTLSRNLDAEEMREQIEAAHVVVDCSDNFSTRFMINRLAVQLERPLVSGAAIRWEGQICSFDSSQEESPCYHCLYSDDGTEGDSCEMEGVVAPLVGIIGAMQAQEVMNVLLEQPALVGKLMVFDAITMTWRTIRLAKDEACPVCGKN